MAIISEYEEDGDTQDVIKADVQEEDDGCDEGEEDYPPDPYFSSIPSDATCSERPHDEVLGYLLREHQLQPLDLLSTVIEFLFRETDIAEQEGVELRVSEMISAAKRRRIDDEDDEDVFGVLRKIAKIEEIVDQSEEPEPLDDEEPTIRKHYPTPYEGAGDIYDVEDCLGVGEESDIPSIQQNFTQDFNASKEPAASPTLEDKAAAEKPEISEPAVGPDNVENEGGKRHKKPLKPNSGNGADLESYSWTQTLSEVTLQVPVPFGTTSKSIMCEIQQKHVKAGVKNQMPLLEGDLSKPVKPTDSFWSLEDGRCLSIHMTKQTAVEWWKCVLSGEPEIDTQQVQPPHATLSDLEPETRQNVEKILFEQQRAAQVLPLNEEANALRKFMNEGLELYA